MPSQPCSRLSLRAVFYRSSITDRSNCRIARRMTIVPQPGCHVLVVVLRSSIERTLSKLAEPMVFYLSRKLPETGISGCSKTAETHNYVARTLYPVQLSVKLPGVRYEKMKLF
jgi:hypothetical protein